MDQNESCHASEGSRPTDCNLVFPRRGLIPTQDVFRVIRLG